MDDTRDGTRPGFTTVTPYIMAVDPEPLITFLIEAFDAVETYRSTGSRGGSHVELRVGDAMVMLGGGNESVDQSTTSAFFLYVEDVDARYDAAVAAGATSMIEPADAMFEEERGAGVVGPLGNLWFLGHHGPDSASAI